MPREILQLLQRRHAWIAAADVTTLSFALGAAKPDPAIYHRCLEDLAVEPARALFVDDRFENVEAAENAASARCSAARQASSDGSSRQLGDDSRTPRSERGEERSIGALHAC